jgi:hypothetical protein
MADKEAVTGIGAGKDGTFASGSQACGSVDVPQRWHRQEASQPAHVPGRTCAGTISLEAVACAYLPCRDRSSTERLFCGDHGGITHCLDRREGHHERAEVVRARGLRMCQATLQETLEISEVAFDPAGRL